MHRLVNDDAAKKSGPAQPGDPRPPKEAAGGGRAIKVGLAAALFAASGFILYQQGVFGGKSEAVPTPAMDPAQAKDYQEGVRRAQEESTRRQKAVDEGRAPKPITSQNN